MKTMKTFGFCNPSRLICSGSTVGILKNRTTLPFVIFICTSVVESSYLDPNPDYNTFVNNQSTAAFHCAGVGIYINWLVNGLSINNVLVRQRSIVAIDDPLVGSNVSSTLHIPTTQENNNTVVMCTVINDLFVTESPPKATLNLQGVLDPPSSCNAKLRNVSSAIVLELTWNAPYSMNITKGKKISHYVLCSTQLGCLNITDVFDCNTCTKTFNSSEPYFVNRSFIAGSQVEMFAVNGAGNGKAATFQIMAYDQRNNESVSGSNKDRVTVISAIATTGVFFTGLAIIISALVAVILRKKVIISDGEQVASHDLMI